jgi:tetratricopeptide (TPR) repeat protein
MNSIMRPLFAIVICAFVSGQAAPLQQWFEKGNDFYEAQKYDSAMVYYEKIAQMGGSSDVYYNLGNAYYRLGKTGLAMLYYEKAKSIDPTDPDILANIKFASMNIVDRVPPPEETFLSALFHRFHVLFPVGAQLWILFGLLMLISILFSAGIFASHNIRLWLVYTGALCCIIALFFGISIGVKVYTMEKSADAIVLIKSVDAMNEPNGSKVQFTAHEGTKFHIRQQLNEWSFVSLPNGVCGWVPDSSFGKI